MEIEKSVGENQYNNKKIHESFQDASEKGRTFYSVCYVGPVDDEMMHHSI